MWKILVRLFLKPLQRGQCNAMWSCFYSMAIVKVGDLEFVIAYAIQEKSSNLKSSVSEKSNVTRSLKVLHIEHDKGKNR